MNRTELPWSEGTNPQTADEAFVAKARTLRPIYFIVVVWGERFTEFLLNFCIPSLLSPNNIPALVNRGKNKFLIATTDKDWERIQLRPIFQLLKQYVEPVFIHIPPRPANVNNHLHMGVGHKLATQMAFEDRAYATILTPDLIVSDGTFAAAQRHAVDGIQVILAAALRFGEEPLFKNLEKLGIAAINSRFGDEARPLVATGRQLVWAGIHSFHSETLSYAWEAPYFSSFPQAVWWSVPGEEGIIVHSLSWAPVLLDYGLIKHHDRSVLDYWTFDGDYVYRNFGVEAKVHVVQDSDEAMLVSWAPLGDREQSLKPKRGYSNQFIGNWVKGLVLHETLFHPAHDPLKRNIFGRTVYWHAREVNVKWDSAEDKATEILRKYGLNIEAAGNQVTSVGRVYRAHTFILRVLRDSRLAPSYIRQIAQILIYYWKNRKRVFGIAKQAVKGDPVARKRVKRSFRHLVSRLTGRPITLD